MNLVTKVSSDILRISCIKTNQSRSASRNSFQLLSIACYSSAGGVARLGVRCRRCWKSVFSHPSPLIAYITLSVTYFSKKQPPHPIMSHRAAGFNDLLPGLYVLRAGVTPCPSFLLGSSFRPLTIAFATL